MSDDPSALFLRRWRPGPLLPAGDARDGALAFVIAVLCFFACLTALAALAGALDERELDATNRTVQPAAEVPRSQATPRATATPGR